MDRRSMSTVVSVALALGLSGALLIPSSIDPTAYLARDSSWDFKGPETLPSYLISWLNPLVRTAKLLNEQLQMPGELALEVAASIHRHTRAGDITPELVVALIKVESGGDPRAVSSKKAVGLMQVHYPAWGKALGVSYEELFDIDTNISAGIHILNHYLELYSDLDKALAAYSGNPHSRRYPSKVMKTYRQMGREI